MKLEDQVCSLELSKQLKEAEVPQKSLFAYYNNPYHAGIGAKQVLWEYKKDGYLMKEFCCSAFTVAELAEFMKDKGMGVTAFASIGKEGWWVRGGEWVVEKQQYTNLETDPKWADALAKMLLYLIKEKLIDPK